MPAYFIRWPGYVYQEWSCKTGKREGPPQFGGMEKVGGGDWLASKGLGLRVYSKKRYWYHFLFPSNVKILSPHLLAFEMQVKTVELE